MRAREYFKLNIDSDKTIGAQLPEISILLRSLSNRRLSLRTVSEPSQTPKAVQINHFQIEIPLQADQTDMMAGIIKRSFQEMRWVFVDFQPIQIR